MAHTGLWRTSSGRHASRSRYLRRQVLITRYIATPIGHRVVRHADVLYLNGVVADDLSADMRVQTTQVCKKIEHLLAEVGSSKEKLLSATIYIADFDRKEDMSSVWVEWLPADVRPCRATIGVATLGQNVLVEVVVTAAA